MTFFGNDNDGLDARRGAFGPDSFIGLPVSHLFDRSDSDVAELLAAAEVLEVKNPAPPAWLPPLPKVFHWGYGIAEDEFRDRFPPVGEYLASAGPSLFSCDLGPSARRHEGILPTSPVMGRKALYERARANMELLRSRYGGPVAFENYNFYPTGLYSKVCDPDFMAEFLDRFGAGLVLDLAHAAISALNMGFETERYLERLPLERTVEIHVSRPYLPEEPGRLGVDTHECPGDREWGWLSFVMERVSAAGARPLVLIEYYKDLSVLKAAMLRLAQELRGKAAATAAAAALPRRGADAAAFEDLGRLRAAAPRG
ncbi:MAG: DUF692 family protein [Deltaproteobacteria bacterium]|jgi:uncharacterized protein (UPF0276 family)|nr:DUF692 family protein [Deltaproteobacteria bacterium]